MIYDKKELKRFICLDNGFFKKDKRLVKYMKRIHEPQSYINKYLFYLRKQEYYMNTAGKNKIKAVLGLLYERKKHNLGIKIGFNIPPNSFQEGLTIFHTGCIAVNTDARIGKNCRLHGNNCIGNNAKINKSPTIGNNVDIGFGAVVIGDITIADNIKIGANAVVNKSFTEPGTTIAGVPAKRVK